MSHLSVLRHIVVQRKRLIIPSVTVYQQRYYSQPQQKSQSGSGSLTQSSGRTDVSTDVRPLGEKIKENTKTASYMGVILLGVGVTGALFYTVFKELFSSSSPNNIYSKALERVKDEPRVQDALGAPIKGFGEESRRGRRQHVAHSKFERDGVPHLRMQFYIQGIRNKATVHLEMKETSGKLNYRFLFVQLDHYPHTTIILEDNRLSDKQALGSGMELSQ